jgi:hypothetical protein
MRIVCVPVVATGVSDVICIVAELIVEPLGIDETSKRSSARREKFSTGSVETVPAGLPTTKSTPAPLLLPAGFS